MKKKPTVRKYTEYTVAGDGLLTQTFVGKRAAKRFLYFVEPKARIIKASWVKVVGQKRAS